MTPVFSPDGARMLARLADERALLVFDFDGTLAPIVADRDRAAMRPETRELLGAAALAYPCAVLSGRDWSDVARRVASASLVEVIGNHGAETGETPPDPRLRPRIRAWAAALEDALRGTPGLQIERKAFSLAVHYRGVSLDRAELARIAALAARLPGSRVFGGHAVLNVVAAESPTKGDAIEALARRLAARCVMFVGGDVTDEDAFQSAAVDYPVRVGSAAHSAARWFVRDQREVDVLLARLVAGRSDRERGDAERERGEP